MVDDVSEKPNSKGLLGGINSLNTEVLVPLRFVFGVFKILFIVGFLTIFFLLLNLLGDFNFFFLLL